MSIGTYFQNRGEKAKEEMDRIVKEEPHRKNLPITPVDLSLSTCLAMSKRLEHNVVLKIGFDSVEREERPFYIGILDITKGMRVIMEELGQAYDSRRNVAFTEQDPKGFHFLKDRVKFWNSAFGANDGSIEDYEDLELVVAGTKLGEQTYKRLYPLAERALFPLLDKSRSLRKFKLF